MLRMKNANPVLSFKHLRRLIGIMGMLLPAVCFLGGKLVTDLPLQRSISFYYYTNVRDALVGLLIGVGMFLITYNGYEIIDIIISKSTGIFGSGIALFPCGVSKGVTDPVGFFQLPQNVSNIIHLSCAAAFFILLAVNSIFIFTLTDNKTTMTANKKKRNVIYVTCGIIILAAVLTLITLKLTIDQTIIDEHRIVFILETVMLEAFGISWLVKGETILSD